MDQLSWLLALSTLAIGICILFALYLFITKSKNKLSLTLLGVFLLSLAIRIGKSVVTLMAPKYVDLLTAIGVVAMMVIGPALFNYVRSVFGKEFVFKGMASGHFSPAIALCIVVPFVYRYPDLIYLIYVGAVGQMLIYLVISWPVYLKYSREQMNHQAKKIWGAMFLGGTGLIWFCFFMQLIMETYFSYVAATLIATMVLFYIGLWAMSRPLSVISGNSPPSNDERLTLIVKKVSELFNETDFYRNEAITVNRIAEHLNLQPYLISLAINSQFGKSLPELVTEYRIRHAKKLLAQNDQGLNIKSVAYESGFSTLSAFYTSFRKSTNMTPREFRDTISQN